jgi:hypothetical protein
LRAFVVKLEICPPFVHVDSLMKAKTLKKKIRRLETRLLEGPKKLAKLKRKLEALVKANAAKAKRKSMAQAADARTKERRSTAKSKPASAEKPGVPKKEKRKLNLSPERREQLAAAMRARWVAKRAAEATSPDTSTTGDFALGQTPQAP